MFLTIKTDKHVCFIRYLNQINQSIQQYYYQVSRSGLNWIIFKKLGSSGRITDGERFKCLERSAGRIPAIQKTRIFPEIIIICSGLNGGGLAGFAKDEIYMFTLTGMARYTRKKPPGDSDKDYVLPEAVVRSHSTTNRDVLQQQLMIERRLSCMKAAASQRSCKGAVSDLNCVSEGQQSLLYLSA
ncbi:hypothetical protein GQ600_21818 [Phytophthora cactorum]|nr:hypothetical protein GQ600_21818 [Phytophthora cactorum]